jgi:lipoprotein-anchoring transpeptidase ErfK/SrfK
MRVTFPLLAALAVASSFANAQKGAADRTAPGPAFDVEAVNRLRQADLRPGDRGPGVLRAQIMLARAHFSCGELDAVYGKNLAVTAKAFRENRNLPAGDSIDAAVWTELNSDTAQALVPYTLTTDDVAGPFLEIPKKMEDQARLSTMAYSSPIEEVAEHFHISPALLGRMNPGADLSNAGQPLTVPNVFSPVPGAAARVVVSKSESSVRAYDAAGKLIAFYVATIGSEHDPLPLGAWKIRGVSRNPAFHYDPNLFWDASSKDKKTLIRPGPNNPVGLVWIDLSKEHYGIHGTPEPSLVGHAYSHGCIRLTNWDALELASLVKPGVPAELKE